jgi:TldD protein
VRVLRGDATGYAYTEELDERRMTEAARTAAQIAASGAAPGRSRCARAARRSLPRRRAVARAAGRRQGGAAAQADAAARAYDPRIVRVEASLAEEWREVLVVTSDGHLARDQQPMIRFGVSAVAEEGRSGRAGARAARARSAWSSSRARPEPRGARARGGAPGDRHAARRGGARRADGGRAGRGRIRASCCTRRWATAGGRLQPQADVELHRPDRQAGRVAAVHVVDDGTIDNARGSINVDDEGNAGQRNVLIEGGTLVGYMQDRLSAKHFRAKPSGNGRRQSFPPRADAAHDQHLHAPGNDDPEDIIKSVKRGVFAKRFAGGQVNISNGDFVFALTESYLIEDGKLTAPLKGTNLIGNGPDVLRKVTMLGGDFELSQGTWTCGKDGQSVPVGIGTPTMKIAEITVGGTKTR